MKNLAQNSQQENEGKEVFIYRNQNLFFYILKLEQVTEVMIKVCVSMCVCDIFLD